MKRTQYFADTLGDIAIELDAIGSGEITPNADIGLCAHITRKFCKQGRVPEGRVCKLFRDYFVEMGLDAWYPVEETNLLYAKNFDKYNPETDFGARRLMLAKELSWAMFRVLDDIEIIDELEDD